MNKALWYKLAVLNLALVAFLGVCLRYNQVYYIPFIDQKNLLHAHSHFAFAGWIGFLLNVLIIDKFLNGFETHPKRWTNYLLILSVVNYGMMISFLIQGYKSSSIIFSTATLFMSYYFAYVVWKDLNIRQRITEASSGTIFRYPQRFVKAALVFLVISSFGPYVLAYLTIIGNTHAFMNHNALYWFLHFQYNGFFNFTILGLLLLNLQKFHLNQRYLKGFYYLVLVACIPAYFLTFLWQGIFVPVLINNIITAVLLLGAAVCFLLFAYKNLAAIKLRYKNISALLIFISLSAYTLKVVLQAVTAFPALSHLVFGYRSIVVGYLHLIFLIYISLFLLTELSSKQIINTKFAASKIAILAFAFFALMNELLLGLQGFSAVFDVELPNLYPALFYNSVLLFGSAAGLAVVVFRFGRLANPPDLRTRL